jgi:hypothetical protein
MRKTRDIRDRRDSNVQQDINILKTPDFKTLQDEIQSAYKKGNKCTQHKFNTCL